MTPRKHTLLFRSAFAACVASITWLALTGSTIPVISTLHDKLQHVLAFAILALLLDFSFPTRPLGAAKLGGLLLYGILIELAQGFTAARDPSLWDVVADVVGLAVYAGSRPVIKGRREEGD